MSTSYQGDSTNFPEAVTVPTDADVPQASTFNPAQEGALDRTSWLRARVIEGACANWVPWVSNPFGAGVLALAVCRDASFGRWLALAETAGPVSSFFASHDGVFWTACATSTIADVPQAIANDPLSLRAVIATGASTGTVGNWYWLDLAAGTVHNNAAFPCGAGGLASQNFAALTVLASAGGDWQWLVFDSTTHAGGHVGWASTTHVVATDHSATLQTGAPAIATGTFTGIYSANDGVSKVLGAWVSSLGVVTSLSLSDVVAVTNTWSAPAFLSTSVTVVGLAFAPRDIMSGAEGVWGILTFDGTSTCALYVSPDAATWTLAHTWANAVPCKDALAAVGGTWVVAFNNWSLADEGETAISTVFYSSNVGKLVGSSTWSRAQLGPPSTGANPTLRILRSSTRDAPGDPGGCLLLAAFQSAANSQVAGPTLAAGV